MKYGSLTVIKEIECDKPGVWVLTRCDCGTFERRAIRHLRSSEKRGSNAKCSICFSESSRKQAKANTTHGLSAHRLYDVHRQMLRRCNDTTRKDFPSYGARGISVCKEWNNLPDFISWALNTGYMAGLTIERIDVNGGYCPENCTWIENNLQAVNTRKIVRITHQRSTRTISEWELHTGISRHTIKNRLRSGWSIDRALTEPPAIGKNQFSL